jgi:uncharacterized membrane protein YvbJ
MIFICPSCGIRLEKDFKFCPNCGYDLSSPAANTDTDNNNGHTQSDIVVCSSCGEENKIGNDFCTSCGARLPSTEKNKVKNVQAPKPRQKTASGKKKFDQAQPAPAPARSISSKQIISVVVIVFAATVLILVAAGVFDSPAPVTLTSQQPAVPQNESPTVDLAMLKEINALEQKVKANPDDIALLLSLAHLKNDAGLPEQAIQVYKQYLEKKPEDADARVDMGVCYYNLKDYKTAIAEMKAALKYKPEHQIAHLNLGIVNLTAGNLEESKEWLKKAVDIDPNSEVGTRAQKLLLSH